MRRRGLGRALLAVALLLEAGCARDRADVPQLALDDAEIGAGSVRLTWSYAGRLAGGFTIEAREGDGAWHILQTGIPGSERELVLSGHDFAEAQHAFRIYAYSTAAVSATSNEVAFYWIRSPAVLVSYTQESLWREGGHEVSWTRRSGLPTEERLERAVLAWDGGIGPWQALPAPPGASSFWDADLSLWEDGARYLYSVVSTYQGHAVRSSFAMGDAAGLAAPGPLSALVQPDGSVRLSWANRSRFVAGVRVLRDATDLGLFPEAVTSTVDLPPPGLRRYGFFVSGYIGRDASSAQSGLSVLVLPPGWSSPLKTSMVELPGGNAAVRTAAGEFALAAQDLGHGSGAIYTRAAPRWAAHAVNGAPFFDPPLLLDAQGVLRALTFAGSPGYGSRPVVHTWLDGTGLHSEQVDAGPSTDAFPGMVAVAADGSLRAVWRDYAATTYASNAGGAWAVETLAVASGAQVIGLAVEPSGASQVAICTAASACELRRRDLQGTWTAEPLPDALAGSIGKMGAPGQLVVPAEGRSILAYDVQDAVSGPEVWALERGPGGWVGPIRLGPGRVVSAALSGDRTRVAMASSSNPESHLFLRDASGWLDIPLLLPSNYKRSISIGFTPAGKVWALEGLEGPATGGAVTYLLHEEP